MVHREHSEEAKVEGRISEDLVTLNKVLHAIPTGGAVLVDIAKIAGLDTYITLRALNVICKDEVAFRYGEIGSPLYQRRAWGGRL